MCEHGIAVHGDELAWNSAIGWDIPIHKPSSSPSSSPSSFINIIIDIGSVKKVPKPSLGGVALRVNRTERSSLLGAAATQG
jgi:hypothetical protein